MSEENRVKTIEITICDLCLGGVGSECHTPECALFLHRVDLPIHPELYREVIDSWQPIESAPKDGTRVLFYDPHSSVGVHAGCWDASFTSTDDGLSFRGAWTDYSVHSFGSEECNEYYPTHWQPLPEPPTN